jgi:Fur family transcriptional regulator, ferric uptake regulator
MPAPTEVRLAKNYRLVYEIVRECAAKGEHVAMRNLFALARHRQPQIGFATIYRALARLEALHLIDEVTLPGSQSACYEPAAPEHAHFRCEECGGVADVDYVMPPRAKARAARLLGAEIRQVKVSLHGRCASCRSRRRR